MTNTSRTNLSTQPVSTFDPASANLMDNSVQSFAQMFEASFDKSRSPVKVADSSQRMWQKYSNSRLRHFSHCQ